MSVDDGIIFYVHCKIAKEMWYIIEIIYGVSPSVKQEELYT